MRRFVLGSILGSMAFGPIPVKTHAEDFASANNDSHTHQMESLRLTRDIKSNWSQLIQVVMNTGHDKDFPNGTITRY